MNKFASDPTVLADVETKSDDKGHELTAGDPYRIAKLARD